LIWPEKNSAKEITIEERKSSFNSFSEVTTTCFHKKEQEIVLNTKNSSQSIKIKKKRQIEFDVPWT